MKLTIARSSLLLALRPCAAVTNRRSPSPFGSCVSLRAAQGSLVIQSANVTTSARATAQADVSKPGHAMVPADDLLVRVESMPDGPISIVAEKSKITLRAGSRVHSLRTIEGSPDAFPAQSAALSDLPGKALADALSSVGYAQHSDEADQPRFAGVVVAANDTGITATASDSKRVARSVHPGAYPVLDTFVPGKAAAVLLGALAAHDGSVSVASSNAAVYVKIGGVELSYQRPGVDAPNYDVFIGRLTATDGPTADRRALLGCLKGVAVSGLSGNVPVVLKCAEGTLTISHTGFDGEPSVDEMAVSERSEGEAWSWTVAAEAKYLIDALGRLGGDTVRVCADEPAMAQPIVIRDDCGGLATIARIDPKTARGSILDKVAA